MSDRRNILSTLRGLWLVSLALPWAACGDATAPVKSKDMRSTLETPPTATDPTGGETITEDPGTAIAGSAIAVIDSRCMSCHENGAGGATRWGGIGRNAETTAWRTLPPPGLIVPGQPFASRLVTKMIHAPEPGNMPPGATTESFPRSDYDLIVAWISQMTPETPEEEIPGGNPPPDRHAAIGLVEKHCMGCHNGAGAPTNWQVPLGSDDDAWLKLTPQGLIVPGNAADSRLTRFMIYSANGTMPVGATATSFPRADYDTIVSWINGLKAAEPEEEEPPALSGQGIFVDGAKIRLGDRNYVADVFAELFGTTTEGESIRGFLLSFGGPCPVASGWTNGNNGNECINLKTPIATTRDSASYVTLGTLTHTLSYSHLDVVDMATPSAPVVSDSTVVREGQRTLVCEKLLFTPTYDNANATRPLMRALQKIDDLRRALSGNSPATLDFQTYPAAGVPSDAELRAAHLLFFNFQEPKPAQLAALREIATRAAQGDVQAAGDWPQRFEPWRYTLYSLCLAPSWQAP